MSTSLALKGMASLLKKRKQVNAITTLGHFATWVIKITMMGSVVLIHFLFLRDQLSKVTLVPFHLGPSINFVIYILVQTLSSHPPRAEFRGSCNVRASD